MPHPGGELGIVEALTMSMLIGLSVDYVSMVIEVPVICFCR